MENNGKIIFLMIMIMILLFCNIIVTTIHISDYSHQKQMGNDRWKQVENRILEVEEKVDGKYRNNN